MGSTEQGGTGGRGRPGAVSTLQTVERALSFMEIVGAATEPVTIRLVADELGINITTCYHLFNTLAAHGYIERNPDSTLRIGFEIAALYDGYLRGSSPARLANELVDRLARESRETAWISSLVDDSVVLTAFADGPQPVRATGLYLGLSGAEHIRSSGRAVLANLDLPRRARILDRALEGVSPEERDRVEARLTGELELVRERGWALDDAEYQPGIVGIAAPIFSADRTSVIGAVGIWSPASRAHQNLGELIEHVVSAGESATATLGRSRT